MIIFNIISIQSIPGRMVIRLAALVLAQVISMTTLRSEI